MDNISLNRNIFHFAGAHFLFLLGIDNLAVAGNGESYVFKDSANAEIELNVLIGIVGNSLRNYVSYAVFALCIYKFVAVLFTADIFCGTCACKLALLCYIVNKICLLYTSDAADEL